SPTDAQTQILWGIDDFTRRFNRAPEGMWLPETAIDSHTIDLLATAGIQFVVLSPWQCKKIENTDGTWKQVHGNDVPYQHAYILEGAHGGKLSAFFYHPELASSISFGHMLRDADAMYRTLEELGRKDSPALIHTATDGEIYGHHEPYGDMALAALIRKVHDGKIFNLTNYATFLEKHPARLGAILHQGEDGRGTSWSCSHGVSRWYKDCGCHTGGEEGWNQAWRSPLREAFDLLGTEIDSTPTAFAWI
ncbi:MAG: glycoside hydrolase, partial [Spirochaetae bacterium HGW-Spirochaetae-8]